MILLLDIGNTRVKWALAEHQKLQNSGVFNVADLATHSVKKVLELQLGKFSNVAQIWISNVGSKSLLREIVVWLELRLSQTINIVKVTAEAAAISNRYHDFESLGVDRWVAAIGARALEPTGDLIVVDIGTAVTIDWLSAANRYEGGVILPGLELMHGALLAGTAHIQTAQIEPEQLIGKTTQQCVNAGVTFGLAGAIKGIVLDMQATVANPSTVLLTGGGAQSLLSRLKLEVIHEPQLMLLGLLHLACYQQKR